MAKILLWAVDALEMEQKIMDCAIDVLRPLSERLGANVQPVYMLTPSRSAATEYSEIAETTPAHPDRPAVVQLLEDGLKNVAIPSLLSPVVLTVESTSLQVAIEELSRYADTVEAEAIVVSSHGRSGLGRFFLGSFAETLMAHAHRPVVVAHPGTRADGFGKALFPTDLGEQSYGYFLEALQFARKVGSEIHILHCVSSSIEPFLQSGVYLLSGGWMPIPGPMNEQIEAVQKTIDTWVDEAEKQGVRASGSIFSLAGGIAETILRVANQDKAGLILMSVQTGPIAAALLGSISREVVRRAPCPVTVMRSLRLKHSVRRASGGKKSAAA